MGWQVHRLAMNVMKTEVWKKYPSLKKMVWNSLKNTVGFMDELMNYNDISGPDRAEWKLDYSTYMDARNKAEGRCYYAFRCRSKVEEKAGDTKRKFETTITTEIVVKKQKVDAEEAISNAMNSSLNDYGNGTKTEVTSSWDNIQHDLKCCGVDTYMDWKNTTFNQQGNTTKYGDDVPDSCCINGPTTGCGNGQLSTHKNLTIYEKGCLKTFEDYIEDNAYIVGGAGAGLGVLQILVLIGSFCIAKRENYYA